MAAVTTKSNQRQRLIDAMIAVAARYGYRDASVARVIREAGVSRATFYKQFEDRHACFAAAQARVAEQVREILEAGGGNSNRTVLGRLLEGAECDPAGARILFIESLAAGAVVRRRHEEVLDDLEDAMSARLDEVATAGSRAELPARALLGGVAGVVALRVFRGEAARLTELGDDLLAWIAAYTLPGDAPRRSDSDWVEMGQGLVSTIDESLDPDLLDRRLPRGRGALPPSRVASEQRERVLAAVALLAMEKGYTAMTVADIVTTAGVTREVFYDLFRSKEDVFLAVQAFGLEASVTFTAGRFFNEDEWVERVWSGLEATLSYVAGQSTLVYVDLVESYAAGPAAVRRSFENRMAYTLFLEDGYRQRPEASHLPRLTSEAISGAMHELFRRQVVSGQSDRMLELLPQAAYLTLAPFIGPAAALELIETKLRTTPRSSP